MPALAGPLQGFYPGDEPLPVLLWSAARSSARAGAGSAIVSGTVVEEGQINGHSPDANRSSFNEVRNRLRLLRGSS
jgi:hypothetical protein